MDRGRRGKKEISDTEPVVDCPGCGKTVPNTRRCLYCGYALHPLEWSFRPIK